MRGAESLERVGLSVFRRLPRRLRRFLIHWGAPRFTVGTALVVRNDNGEVLLVRQRHTGLWALPGGLLRRGERADVGVRREVREEVGLSLPDLSPPAVVVDPVVRRVDVVFTTSLRPGGPVRSSGPEVLDVGWFAPSALPDVTGPTVVALQATATD